MDSFSFRIPEQQPPAENSFDTRAAAVQRWVEELPLGHAGETAKRLYEVMREVNRLDIPLAERFEMMEGISTPLHAVLESLERHYSAMPFPLPKKSVRVAQFSTGILHEVVIAYQAVLNSEENASWFYRMTHSRLWLESVHRLVYYLNRILCNYRLIHRSAPGGVWLALHRLYWTARENRRQQEKVKSPLTDLTTTIEGEYKQALLLSMLDPQLFNRAQTAQLLANMPMWQERCELVEAGMRGEELVGYCIRREADAPHTKLTEVCCKECDGDKQAGLLLDLSSLERRIAGLLEQLGEEEQLKPKGGSTISRATLETLRSCWRTFDGERHERTRSNVRVEVAIGMSGIFHLLQEKAEATAQGISDQHMSDELEELTFTLQEECEENNLGTVMGERAEEDVWSSIFRATEITQKSWSSEVDEREYRFIQAQQRDYTDTGYCLEFEKEKMEPFQVGELVGVQEGTDKLMHLCMVRWLNDDEGSTISTGVMRLADSMEPALVLARQERRRTALYCLLGIGADHKPQLFLPHLPGIHSKQLFLVVDGKEVPLTLHDRVVVSPLFDAYHFHAVSVAADEEMSLEQMNRQLHGLTRSEEEAKKKKDGDFSDLWNSL